MFSRQVSALVPIAFATTDRLTPSSSHFRYRNVFRKTPPVILCGFSGGISFSESFCNSFATYYCVIGLPDRLVKTKSLSHAADFFRSIRICFASSSSGIRLCIRVLPTTAIEPLSKSTSSQQSFTVSVKVIPVCRTNRYRSPYCRSAQEAKNPGNNSPPR